MSAPGGNGRGRYEALRQEAVEAFRGGDLDRSEVLFDSAIEAARELDEPRLVDTARCNRSAVRIARGHRDDSIAELRQILMATPYPEVSFLSSYNIARAYELGKETKKGLFYARIARDRAELVDRPEWLYAARHQIANFLTADSSFDDATAEYETALSLLPEARRDEQHEAQINLAYCDLMRGRTRQALTGLYRTLRKIVPRGLKRLEALARQDLSLALLEGDRPDLGWRHASRALELARSGGEADVEKNCLFLLGECAEALGRREDAFALRRDLQNGFYPDQPELPWLLARIDARKILNLRA